MWIQLSLTAPEERHACTGINIVLLNINHFFKNKFFYLKNIAISLKNTILYNCGQALSLQKHF